MMNMHGPYNLFDLGITDPAIIDSLSSYNNSPFTAGGYAGLLSPSENSSCKTDEIPPRVRHDGTSPLPLGMDWSPPPPVWDGKNTVWPHDYRTGWSYCVTIPSWTLSSDCRDSESVVLYKVLVGIQSPQGITTTREIQRRFSDFVTLSSDLRKEFPKKKLPPAPRKGLLRIKNSNLLEERRRLLGDWMTNVLSDIDLSRSLQVAIFVELEAAVRSSFDDSNNNLLDEDSSVRGIVQDEKLQAVSTNSSILQENETLRRELDAAHQQLKNLQNHTLEMDSESTTDLKLPVKLLHECLNLRTRLEECSISFHIENENVLIMETPSPSDALVTSDDQIDLLLAEAELLAQDVGGDSEARDAGLRKMLTGLLMDNARLRKQMNSVVRCAMSAPK